MWAFLNDQFIPEEKALLHSSDLSIQRGYGIFDFFKVVNAVPVFLKEHLDRFYFSAEQMRLDIGYSKEELKNILFELLRKNEAADIGVRLTLTGGYSSDGYQISKPNLIISLRTFTPPSKDLLSNGIKLMTYEHQRQLPHVKTIDYLIPVWLQPLVKQNNADDILYHQKGIVTECPRSNFFIVTNDNRIITPSKNILKGVMRMKVIEVAQTKFKVEEREVSIEEIRMSKEAFITSTTKNILPVCKIDDHTFSGQNSAAQQLQYSLIQLQSGQIHAI